jgi:hypothetical protein
MYSATEARQALKSANVDSLVRPVTEKVKQRVEENVKRDPHNRWCNSVEVIYYRNGLNRYDTNIDAIKGKLQELGYTVTSRGDAYGTNDIQYTITVSW